MVEDGIGRFRSAIEMLEVREELPITAQAAARPKTAKSDVFDYSYGGSMLHEGVLEYLRNLSLNGKKFNYQNDYKDCLEEVEAAKDRKRHSTASIFDDFNLESVLTSEDN